ncbi:MAG: LysM peptidoglycan-binding domain-containing protein [Bacteroidota bacterium]
MYRLLILPLTLVLSQLAFSQPNVPAQLEYCGTTLYLNSAAQAQIATYVAQIHQSPRYFQEMVHRARLYMPFIEQAFAEARVPQDLKYLAIQESGLRPSVVSSSQAVGFWQFKAGAASDMGLEVSNKIDERRHIYRASQAAAGYLAKNNGDFNNWLYAVIAYYEGPTGAIKHTDPANYGQKQMQVTDQLHWYVMKAIAHKVAYEAALRQPPQAPLYLRAHHQAQPTQLRDILQQHQLSREEFLSYNQWLLNPHHLGRLNAFVYFTPSQEPTGQEPMLAETPPAPQAAPTTLLITDAPEEEPEATSLALPAPQPEARPVPTNPESQPPTVSTVQPTFVTHMALDELPASRAQFVLFPMEQDLHYGQQYVMYDGNKRLIQIAETYGKPLSKLLVWNGLLPGEEPSIGRMVYMEKPSKREFHIVRPGESLESIADLHLQSVRKLQKRNSMRKNEHEIFVGQKLYLSGKRPREEKMIILSVEEDALKEMVETPAPRPASSPQTGKATAPQRQAPAASATAQSKTLASQPPSVPTAQPSTQPATSVQEVKTRWITHTVSPGETLWQISQQYGTKVGIIKMINKLVNDSISEGQQLRILAKEELLQNAAKSPTAGLPRE